MKGPKKLQISSCYAWTCCASVLADFLDSCYSILSNCYRFDRKKIASSFSLYMPDFIPLYLMEIHCTLHDLNISQLQETQIKYFLHICRVKNNCWPLAIFRAKLPNSQALNFLKVVGRLGQPKVHELKSLTLDAVKSPCTTALAHEWVRGCWANKLILYSVHVVVGHISSTVFTKLSSA